MTIKQSLAIAAFSAVTSVGSVWGYNEYQQHQQVLPAASPANSLFKPASYTAAAASIGLVDFEHAATKAAPAVVHIKTQSKPKQVAQTPNGRRHPLQDFFGDGFGDMFGERGNSSPSPQRRGSGSGVTISADGYIVTNNHVIDGADEVTVTLNNSKDYKAKVIGKDASTDLAVIKIDAKDLPYLEFANSDEVRLGQWVLAIGYPLGLQTTVTSGIVSAKSRGLGINSRQSRTPVEAFIQTDAAINPGNSGGALVNTDGNVIGINSAIASPTGSYAGYGYAIPSNMVKKIVADLVEFGSAKRAYLGIMYGNDQMTEEDRKANNVKEGKGVFVMEVSKGSAAEEAGVKKGDFITKINGKTINTGTEMIEQIAALRPGEKVQITYQQNGKEKTATATLKGEAGSYASIQEKVVEQLGATFENLDKSKAAQLQLSSGVVVKSLQQGILTEQTRIKEGFIITKVNNIKVNSVEELKEAIKRSGNSAIISGVYPSQPQTEYRYALNDLQ
ncbi:Do family serine endopeptidase [Aridibaculum aurantiacum]|uniref:Do family serine endopeptidase n=1 Tax=Aridibaculum aurantiacum TaxID=2810307 RepID=UPI001A95652D|nr:Do family serine endopeptidase [Aridibaculum aurantiacum]